MWWVTRVTAGAPHLQLTALSSQLGSGNEENSALADQVNQLNTSLRAAQSCISELEQQVQQLQSQLSSKDKELGSHTKKLSSQERRLQEAEAKLKELHSQVASKEAELDALREGSQAEVALAAKRLLNAQKAASDAGARVTDLEGDLVKAKAAQQEAVAGGRKGGQLT
jgi:chromosome segregation ATPase